MRWESSGEGEFTVETIDVEPRGTEVVLHLRDGEDELLDRYRLRSIVHKYSDHVSIPILMPGEGKGDDEDKDEGEAKDEETINTATALVDAEQERTRRRRLQGFLQARRA